uniref:Uncharacterized protein n=1 Tax=Podarcis muralis TaxID=64176 RepID=A0A670KJ18_PODMU
MTHPGAGLPIGLLTTIGAALGAGPHSVRPCLTFLRCNDVLPLFLSPWQKSELAAAIAVPCVFGGLLLIGLLVFMGLKIREKRQTEGTYRPAARSRLAFFVFKETVLRCAFQYATI